jgi:phenylalanyl-tRNA synthetase beta chain
MKISKYPSIRRDISIIITEDIQVADVMKCVKNAASDLVNNLELFDVYRGEGIDSGKKSLALGLTFQKSSSTLTDEEADIAVGNVLQALYKQFGAILRE